MTTASPLRMGTRASALARAQSGAFAAELTRRSGRAVEVVIVRTQGDQLSSEGKAPPGGDAAGVFVRALDDALRNREIDFAVHSLKDVPTADAEGLVLAAVPARADGRDAFVVASRHAGVKRVEDLPQGAGWPSSPRRLPALRVCHPHGHETSTRASPASRRAGRTRSSSRARASTGSERAPSSPGGSSRTRCSARPRRARSASAAARTTRRPGRLS